MDVTRIQYPVGQGCFHAGCLRWGDGSTNQPGEVHYVYDCGSTDNSALREAIETYRAQTAQVDALFVSHLHNDHVNGIDLLLNAVKVNTVFIPYVDAESSVLNIVQADLNDAISASLVEVSIDPRSWFGRRGVLRIVRVLASPDGGVGEADAEDDEGPDGEAMEAKGLVWRAKSKEPRLPSARSSLEEMESGTIVQVARAGGVPDWVLVPHVDPAPEYQQRQAFMKAVESVCGLRPHEDLTARRLMDALRNNTKRKSLRNCYEQIISGGSRHNHNRVSMSLYSGPPDLRSGRPRTYRASLRSAEWSVYLNINKPRWFLSKPSERTTVGWIGTGDATLSSDEVRKAWKTTYHRFLDQIATLLLPHHGSKENFDRDLLDCLTNLELCVAAAGDPSPFRHPSLSVIHEIMNSGKQFCCVSQRPLSGIHEELCE